MYDLNEPKAAKLLLDYAISEIKKENLDLVEKAGFEPANAYADRFTVCCH